MRDNLESINSMSLVCIGFMKEKPGFPDFIKMCPLGDRYRFRPNGDFMLLFYCDRAKGLYLPETVTHLYSGIF